MKRGDIYQLGAHRLMCGDSMAGEDVDRLFDGKQFQLCFTSPMYTDQRNYKLEKFDWHEYMCRSFDQMVVHGKSDCHILINIGLSHKKRQVDMYWLQWLLYCASIAWPVFGWYVWDKGGMPRGNVGRLSMSHEFLFHFSHGGLANKWIPTKGHAILGEKFRQKDGTFKKPHSPENFGQPLKIPDSVIRIHKCIEHGSKQKIVHPAKFPVALVEYVMQTWSRPDDCVYEPFCGSGTSIIAGENLKRSVYAMEIEPSYCEIAVQRWERLTGCSAVLV